MSWYRMQRGWKDHEFFSDEPYSERDAWQWMIEEAHWKPGVVSVAGIPTSLKRGQFTASIRFMAGKFQWSKDRVQRFLKRCVSWGMIESQTATGQYIITICNYEKYQDYKDAPKDTGKDGFEDTTKDAPKDKQEEGKEIKKVKNKRARSRAAVRPENISENVWEDFISQRSETFTETALDGIRKQAEIAGWVLEDALREAVTRGWQSFKADWVREKHETNRTNRNKKYTDADALSDVIAEIDARAGQADSPPSPAMLCDSGHLREITGAIEDTDASDDRRPKLLQTH